MKTNLKGLSASDFMGNNYTLNIDKIFIQNKSVFSFKPKMDKYDNYLCKERRQSK